MPGATLLTAGLATAFVVTLVAVAGGIGGTGAGAFSIGLDKGVKNPFVGKGALSKNMCSPISGPSSCSSTSIFCSPFHIITAAMFVTIVPRRTSLGAPRSGRNWPLYCQLVVNSKIRKNEFVMCFKIHFRAGHTNPARPTRKLCSAESRNLSRKWKLVPSIAANDRGAQTSWGVSHRFCWIALPLGPVAAGIFPALFPRLRGRLFSNAEPGIVMHGLQLPHRPALFGLTRLFTFRLSLRFCALFGFGKFNCGIRPCASY